ncbi:putative dipeptidyl-aminopeptidase B [Aulographum hederae CBS 113979]|uniref:dipeptidyl-peptidase IV n=1 Tax=Aulographum hederae CBS 113979 TaxID=1176131 RepID=A0A6G1HGE1_9PEZI|nr:putative dipeptidyl-aminopeptidase B [Aulographum hederae CBS 113979]
MAKEEDSYSNEENKPLTHDDALSRRSQDDDPRFSMETVSTTSLILDHVSDNTSRRKANLREPYSDSNGNGKSVPQESFDIEEGAPHYPQLPADKKFRKLLWILGAVAVLGWLVALATLVSSGAYKHASTKPHDPSATVTPGSGHKVTLDSVLTGQWYARKHQISWIAGKNGEDGLVLEKGESGKDYLVVEDVRHRKASKASSKSITLMKEGNFQAGKLYVVPSQVWPSPDFKKVLVMSDRQSNWRHSFTGLYYIFDVETQTAEALDPMLPNDRIQLASWSPQSDAIVFTRYNNMYLRRLNEKTVVQITKDGGTELFNGVPDWVYEEEVFGGNSATWWSEDGEYIAFLRTDEKAVPTYPVQYFLSRPSGKQPKKGEENYPEVRNIKYPKAGAPNPTVDLQFYDVKKNEIFAVKIEGDFDSPDRLITEVVWAGTSKKVLIKETNRESDVMNVILIDVSSRSGKSVRKTDIAAIDKGWFEVSEDTTFIPADPSNDRPHDGYVDTVIHEGYDHLAYFSPIDNDQPVLLTSGTWEVVKAPSAIDLKNNKVYFVATKHGSIQRHVYRVNFDGTGLESVTDTTKEGYYDVSFSTGAGYGLLSYSGPGIPWQKVISTPSAAESYEDTIEDNHRLAAMASEHELPIKVFSTIHVDGFELNVVERRPPHFDPKKKYPVLFWMYQGPGSQMVDKKFTVDFQAYVASSLGYIVVTVDGRGTGYLGRKLRCSVRGNIGYWESTDQIAAAKIWAKKSYVDSEKMAIWGWSYGGFMALKTLERDAGETFKYGMAVAPVTDWRFYDSIYTERYMHTPQNNPGGYDNSTISDVRSLSKNVRFLVMHGVADDNVHMQSTLTLLDKLDVDGIENYDVHVFPDSDHGIYFHNANRIVYDKLSNWLVNAFNGEWLKTDHPVPVGPSREKRLIG